MNREEGRKSWEELNSRYEEEFKKVEDLRRQLHGQSQWLGPYERIEHPESLGNTSRRDEIRKEIMEGEQRLNELLREMDEAEKRL